jgi:hypothetical protein
MSATARLLDRLDGAKPTGEGRWIAKCPAHADRSPSLSIRDVDDRVLLHCFAGCEVGDVLAALGLGLSDLFDKPLGHHLPPTRSRIPARDLLELIGSEVDVAVVLLQQALDHKAPLTELAWSRLAQAAARIGQARVHAYGH